MKLNDIVLFIAAFLDPINALILIYAVKSTLQDNTWITDCLEYVIMALQVIFDVAKTEFDWHVVRTVWW